MTYAPTTHAGDGWILVNGDSCEELWKLDASSVDFSVYSPPFASLYTYTASERDIGNAANWGEFFGHFDFVIKGLLQATKPGRLTACHVAQIPAMKERDGFIGLKDFRGATIKAYQDAGWIYHGEVCIDKDPQAQAIRTKSKGLLFIQMRKDSSWSRMALADYILLFRAPGENAVAIHPDISNDDWIEWARPIWYGIRESDTLQVAEGRDSDDERHICPLQLGTIERCIRLWSNPGELVVSPFAGIGSEGFEAVRLGRRFWGCELKPSYARLAVRNLATAVQRKSQCELFEEPIEAVAS
jgi:DNA modification methylase